MHLGWWKQRRGAFAAALVGALSSLTVPALSAPPAAVTSDLGSVYQKVKPSVVYVVVATASGAQSGSGFVYDSDAGHTVIATADHVVAGGQRIDVIFDSNVKLRYRATVLEHDRRSDVAFLDVALGNRTPLRLAERAQIVEGNAIAAIGYPRAARAFETVVGDDLRPSIHAGIVSAVRLNGEIVQVDAQIDHGDSGGPVIDVKSGRVIGIVDAQLLDPQFAARGLEKPLPGSAYAVSAPTVYAVRNGLAVGAGAAAGSGATTTVAGGSAAVRRSGESSAAYRVAFVTASFSNAVSESIETQLTQRVREHFTGGNTFYAIPATGLRYTESSVIARFCDDYRVNAIVIPVFTFAADAAQAGNAAVRGTLIVSDCAGVPYFIAVKTKRESRMFANRSAAREVLDMGNDLVDQLLRDFDDYRVEHAAAWTALLKTGLAADPGAKEPPVSVGVLLQDHQYRVGFMREDGRGAKAGLQSGDVIVSIDGMSIPPQTTPFAVSQMLEHATEVLVRRPDGDKKILLRS